MFVLGGINFDGECWSAEIQIVGGHEVVAEVYSDSEENVTERQAAVLEALNRLEAQ